MSIQAVAWAMKQETGSPTLKLVLIAVANYADEKGRCWPSQERLAADTEITDRSIREALKKLEAAGFLTRTHRQVNGNKRQTDIIQLVYSHRKFTTQPPEDISGGPPEDDDTATGSSRQNPPEAGSGKPSIEPSLEEPSARGADAPAGQIIPFPPVAIPEKQKRLSRLPTDFTLTPERIAFARKEGMADETARREFDKFTGHHGAKGSKFLDWNLAWQNWVRKAVDGFGGPVRSASGGYGAQAPSMLRAYQRAAARFTDPIDDAE